MGQQDESWSPRRIALGILDAILDRRSPFDEILAADRRAAALPARDRAFAYNLVATTLRRLGQVDDLIAHAVARPLPRTARCACHVLRLGVCQLAFLGTPAHAAVSTSVVLAGELGLHRHLGLINAVLRRLSREAAAIVVRQDAARLNTPDWLWNAWLDAYGEEQCRRIAEAHLHEPPLDLTARGDAEVVAAAVGGTVLPTGSVRLRQAGVVSALPGYVEGQWWVQDAAAALPAPLLGDVTGRLVVDLCAAPGGKAAQLAAAGARVIAVERSADRMRRLGENLHRLGLTVETVIADATEWRPPQLADAVLVDAPCTATGTIRRHPDVARIKEPGDMAAMAAQQRRLLINALSMTRPGGLVVYCTCSLQPEETSALRGIAASPPVPCRIQGIYPEEVGGLREIITATGEVRTLPFHLGDAGGMDGFYVLRLSRM